MDDSINDATDLDASARDDGTLHHDRLLSEDCDAFNPHITVIRRCAPSSRVSGVYSASTSRPMLRLIATDGESFTCDCIRAGCTGCPVCAFERRRDVARGVLAMAQKTYRDGREADERAGYPTPGDAA